MDWMLVLVSLVSAALTVGLALWLVPAAPESSPAVSPTDSEGAVFLFDGDHLLDATDDARAFLDQSSGQNDWDRALSFLSPRFPGLTQCLQALAETGQETLKDTDGHPRLHLRHSRGVTRITLRAHPEHTGFDAQGLSALTDEVALLRDVTSHLPVLAWMLDQDGNITWANRAYLEAVSSQLEPGQELSWPLPHLFASDPAFASGAPAAPHRAAATLADGITHWYECAPYSVSQGTLVFAQPADATVLAETNLRNFRQTLTKTFAGLTIGIAIFNRSRELVMFNPALLELCAVEPQFLAARPTLSGFLDRLREKQMIPEPKDYKSWRHKMSALEEEAASGTYREVWTLPSGQTYRVTGQPHPDGAVAFLFEDISAEISLTRSFRSELEMGQAVIDGLDEAIAVFSPAGVLSLSNTAYARLWDSDPSTTLCEISLPEAIAHWRDRCKPSAHWSELQELASDLTARQPRQFEMTLSDGSPLFVRLKPLAGKATLIAFAGPDHVQEHPQTEHSLNGA